MSSQVKVLRLDVEQAYGQRVTYTNGKDVIFGVLAPVDGRYVAVDNCAGQHLALVDRELVRVVVNDWSEILVHNI